jgi:calcineurin-like phosphoesterase family protein
MKMIFFTADTHFQHDKILGYCDRPFANVAIMDSIICDNWNYAVGPKDTVYHLGDVGFGDINSLLPLLTSLNGKKFLVPGNHDRNNKIDILSQAFEILPPLHTEIFRHNGSKVLMTMCHYPMQAWNGSFHGSLHFFGHVHGQLENEWQRLDVGVDSWNFKPVPLPLALQSVKIPTQEDRDSGRCVLE